MLSDQVSKLLYASAGHKKCPIRIIKSLLIKSFNFHKKREIFEFKLKEILLFSTNAYLELDDLKQMTHLADIRFSSSFKNSRNNFIAES